MSTTASQDGKFIQAVISGSLLEDSIDWVKSNLSPTDVFDEKELVNWATGMEVDSIFPASDLEKWAEANGYVKE